MSNGDPKALKRYNYMENVLQHVITKISVKEEDKKLHTQILKSAIDVMLSKMRETSPLFSKLYTKTFYGGSYYDNLKTGKPDEFDIDLLMVLSKKQIFTLTPLQEAPGFVTLKMTSKSDAAELAEFFDGEFLCTSKVLKWMESTVSKALQGLPASGSQSILNINGVDFFIKIVKSGPAFTLKLNGQIVGNHTNFDVDLVPCFLFNAHMWPQGNFRRNPVKDKTDFFIVPKQPKGNIPCKSNHCWRLSFQEQERLLIHDHRTLKPCIKLLKKLRDNLQHNAISSYFIKTMFMWHIERTPKGFFENSLSYVFVQMLQEYAKHLQEHQISYYWNTDNNLIGGLGDKMLENYSNRVRRIVADINGKEENNPYYVAKYFLLSEGELEQLKVDVPMPTARACVQDNGANSDGNVSSGGTSQPSVSANGEGSGKMCSQCSCGQLDQTLNEIRRELAEARREQDVLKADILDLLQVVVRRLDQLETKHD